MSLISRIKTWGTEILKSADLNSEFNNVVNTINNLDGATAAWTNVKAGVINATTSLQAASVVPSFSATLGTIATSDSLSTIVGKVINARIVQIVQATLSGVGSTVTSSSFSDAGLSTSITPQLNGNKVLVIANFALTTANQASIARATLLRGATNLGGTAGMSEVNSAAGGQTTAPCCLIYLDSPATASATTYKVQILSSDNVHNVLIGDTNMQSQIICVEIGA